MRREKLIASREKLIKFHKIHLIYELKVKSNDIGQRIGRKTCNLTRNHTQKDQINCQIKPFPSAFQKNKN